MKRHMFAMICVGLGMSALVSLGGCSAAQDDSSDAQGGEEALSRQECGTRADSAKKKLAATCTAPRDAARNDWKTCTGKVEKDYQDFTAKLKAAAPTDAQVQDQVNKCLEGSACEARQSLAKSLQKPVSEVESPGFRCTISEWFNSLFSSCNDIDANAIGSAEYKALVAQRKAKTSAFFAGLRTCMDKLDDAMAVYRDCTGERADAEYDRVYKGCRAECPSASGTACAPEGESIQCGVSGNKREGALWLDKGCVCQTTKVCDQYHDLESQLKTQAEKEGVRCDMSIKGADGTPLAGIFRPEIIKDASGAPTGVRKICVSRK